MKMHRACKICGEIGHTYKEHQDGCPYCEASHLGEECPTTQVTCFMCEGTNHNPAQCRLLTVTQEVVQQQRKGVKKAIQKFMAAPMKKRKKDISYITCHKCGNKGHYSSKCRARGTMPTRVRKALCQRVSGTEKRERKMVALLQPVPRIEKREREMETLEQRSPMTCQE